MFFKRKPKGEQTDAPKVAWLPLTEETQLEAICAVENTNKTLVFKHSTRCGISSMVLRSFNKKYAENKAYTFYYLDLLKYRALSNTLAERFKVVHQSPQVLLIKNGKVLHHASHYDITTINLDDF